MTDWSRGVWNGTKEAVVTFVLKFANDWSMNLASMTAYSLITAIFPLLLVILSVVGIILQVFAYNHLNDVAGAISAAFPETKQGRFDFTPLLHSLIQITGPLAIVSLVALLWLGSNLFATMENAFSIIFRIRGRDLVQQRIMAFGMVLMLTILLPVSLATASFVTVGSTRFSRLLPPEIRSTLTYVGPLTSLGVLWLLFLVIYMVVPNFEVRFRQAWPGALVAAILFGLWQLLFPLYAQLLLNGNTRYGASAALILFIIIWLWFFALITIIGAQINAVAMGLKATPYDLARTFELSYEVQDTLVGTKRKTTPTRLKRLATQLLHGRPSAPRGRLWEQPGDHPPEQPRARPARHGGNKRR